MNKKIETIKLQLIQKREKIADKIVELIANDWHLSHMITQEDDGNKQVKKLFEQWKDLT